MDRITQGKFGFNVWCAIYNCRILVYHIFEGNLTAERYCQILEDNLFNLDLNNVFFQQDGAPSHNARRINDILNERFGEQWMGTNGPVRWPARSPDLTPLDFFLWGFLKNEIYETRSNNINELRIHFRNSLRKVTHMHIYNATRSVEKRCRKCLENNGLQFEHKK